MAKVTVDDLKKFCHKNSIIDFLGVEIVPTSDDKVRLELFVEDHHTNPYGMLHGGVITTMVDTAMGAECLIRGKKVVTVSLTVEFMKAVPNSFKIFTDAKVLHEGRQICICECSLRDAEGEIYAKAHATFFAIQ